MLTLINSIGQRLRSSAYTNEAAISHGIVTPVLSALGWDTADPLQVRPEFANARGRVDFALLGLGQKPAVFVEVKAVGRSLDGDRQLFEYAFHEGVPLCILTDGREWNFYLPSGQGSYNDRRVYRLQLDDRDPGECQAVFIRYLERARILNHSAIEAAIHDHRDAARRRQGVGALPRAWSELLDEANELVLDALLDKAESLSGYKPSADDALIYLRSLTQAVKPASAHAPPDTGGNNLVPRPKEEGGSAPAATPAAQHERAISYSVFGRPEAAPNASVALTDILRTIVSRDPSSIPKLSAAVRSRRRSHIDRSPELINPGRPDLARAVEIAPGWLVGLTISNREKMMIIRSACEVYGLTMPHDVQIDLPNA